MRVSFSKSGLQINSRNSQLLLALAIALYIVMLGVLATQRHLAYQTSALDMGNHDQAMWNAAHGRGLLMSTQPALSVNRMGHHVEPILFALVPLYWLWPNPLALVWVQTLALGLAAWPLFLLARKWIASEWSALAIAVAYLLLPATSAVNLFDFHAVSLSPVLMLWAFYFLDRDKNSPDSVGRFLRSPAILFLALAMGCKEDISLHVMMVGLYVALIHRRRLVGLTVAALGLAWAFTAFGVVIPAFRTGGGQSAFMGFFVELGRTPLEVALSPFTKPAVVWQLVTRPENWATLAMVTLPFGLLGLPGLPVLLLGAPTFAISFLSTNPFQQQLETWHYAAPLLPFVALAAADGLARIKRYRANLLPLFTLILLVSSLGYHYLRGYSPMSKPFTWPQVTAHHALGDELAATIPPSARVVAQAELLPRLSQRDQVSIWRGDLPLEADYVFMDISHPKFVNQDRAQFNFLSTMARNKNFGLVAAKDGYIILKQGAERVPTQAEFQTFLRADSTWTNRPELARFDDLFSLVGHETHLNREAEPQMTVYFRVLQQPQEDYFLRLYLLNQTGRAEGATIFEQPALVWWPTHLWLPGDIIKVRFNTLPWWTGDGLHQRFSYALGISSDAGNSEADAWNLSLRLPATGVDVLPDNLVHLQDFYRLAGMPYPSDE